MGSTNDLLGEIEDFTNKQKDIGAEKLGELGAAVQELKKLYGSADPDHVERIYKSLEKNVIGLSLATLEEVHERLEKRSRQLAQVIIPGFLNDLQLSELKLNTGEKITIKNEVKAHVNEQNKKKLIEEMAKIEADYRGISIEEATDNVKGFFKEKLLTEFNPDIENEFIEKGLDFEHKIEIHYQTLNKYVRDNLELGLPIPDSLTVYQYQEAKIK